MRHIDVERYSVSDALAWWIAQANTLAELRGWTQFIGLQLEYSLIERTVERELIPMAKALNLGVLAFSPLAGGFLTGKYHEEGKPDGGRMTNEGVKAFFPEREQRAAPIIHSNVELLGKVRLRRLRNDGLKDQHTGVPRHTTPDGRQDLDGFRVGPVVDDIHQQVGIRGGHRVREEHLRPC